MITVDRDRCAYCGGCVSTCPEGALSLAETRLLVSGECTECGQCVDACPVGALSLGEAVADGAGVPVRQRYDAVVVGAGPGGSVAAKTLAEAGLSVLLLEKRQEIGSPVRCAEGVGCTQLEPFIEPNPLWIAAEVSRAEITTIAGDQKETVSLEGGAGYILERRVFDRVLAERAAITGAEVRVKTAAAGLLMKGSRVCGVRIDRPEGLDGCGQEVEAEVVIAADGVESQVGYWAGLDVHLPLDDTMVCAQYLLAGIDVDPACTRYTIGHGIAPGGYAWVFPKGEGKANVGLGVQADLWEAASAKGQRGAGSRSGGETVLDFLIRYIESDASLAQGYPVTLVAGNAPVALSPRRTVTDGLMLVGDAARQVDPLTGGGIINAMTAGELAARVAVKAIAVGNVSASFLGRYEEEWQRRVGHKLRRNYHLRERFPPRQRASRRFVRAFGLAAAG
jgi:digeranylgeranylglycerophospholipid reductase